MNGLHSPAHASHHLHHHAPYPLPNQLHHNIRQHQHHAMPIGTSPTNAAPNKVPIQPTPGVIRKTPNTKPKQRKSRTGCMTCKAKRLKCDEKKVLFNLSDVDLL